MDDRCPCGESAEGYGCTVLVHDGFADAWTVSVSSDGFIVDSFRSRTLNAALEAVHREYPLAKFNPEEA